MPVLFIMSRGTIKYMNRAYFELKIFKHTVLWSVLIFQLTMGTVATVATVPMVSVMTKHHVLASHADIDTC